NANGRASQIAFTPAATGIFTVVCTYNGTGNTAGNGSDSTAMTYTLVIAAPTPTAASFPALPATVNGSLAVTSYVGTAAFTNVVGPTPVSTLPAWRDHYQDWYSVNLSAGNTY